MLYSKIKKICQVKGISVRQLESDLEFSSGSVCKWDDNTPSWDRVTKAADYLGVSLDELAKDDVKGGDIN